ncbi:hypothetical protein D3C76_1232510 [compost metagenome]
MTVELDVIDRRISLHVLQHDLQLGFRGTVELDPAAREADLGLFHLLEVLRQQFGHAALIIGKRPGEPDRQQAHFRHPAISRGMANHRAATVHQTADQASGLHL